ncbi:MAG: 1-deoxy-D-xylulose-5-phosphate reductoisomerase [Thermodesulfobacteriota bacterium]
MSRRKKGLAVLGSTGSIGRNALDIVRSNPDKFRVVSLAAGRNIALLKKQIEEFRPEFVSVEERDTASSMKRRGLKVGFGVIGACAAATFDGVDKVVSAIVGAAGFLPTYSAIMAGKDIALANKETLVIGGSLVMREVKKRGTRLIPVDSEHSAVFQSLEGHRKEDVRRIILTASGGPFLKTPLSELRGVTTTQALKHPTWSMGKRITIDSATLMNKGFEVIEAGWLFGLAKEKISVVIHPQSVVHSMVEYIDGSIISQMGSPDMKIPISYALGFPERIPSGAKEFRFDGKRLEFFEPDVKRFPCLALAYRAMTEGESFPCALNAADEVCVEKFIQGVIKFTDIPRVIGKVLDMHSPHCLKSVEDVMETDRWARETAYGVIKKREKGA